MIEITEVRVSLRNDDKLKAFVSITLNHSFVIRGLKVIRGNSGLFVAMPSRLRPDGQHQDLAHPINDSTRKYLTSVVMAEYERELERYRHEGSTEGALAVVVAPQPYLVDAVGRSGHHQPPTPVRQPPAGSSSQPRDRDSGHEDQLLWVAAGLLTDVDCSFLLWLFHDEGELDLAEIAKEFEWNRPVTETLERLKRAKAVEVRGDGLVLTSLGLLAAGGITTLTRAEEERVRNLMEARRE